MNDENGVLTFKTTHVIEPRDVKKREANAGEKWSVSLKTVTLLPVRGIRVMETKR